MRVIPTRFLPLLLMLWLAGCGQTGPLFMRMPNVRFPTLAPPLATGGQPIWLPPGTTLPAPVSATAPVPPGTTHLVPLAVTAAMPSATTHVTPAASTHP
ncbi:MAG TPA: lipoprotein [Gammaproteobacteria bacterium]|nr:lipoprotein [Gammaproteobacteria bacterium]